LIFAGVIGVWNLKFSQHKILNYGVIECQVVQVTVSYRHFGGTNFQLFYPERCTPNGWNKWAFGSRSTFWSYEVGQFNSRNCRSLSTHVTRVRSRNALQCTDPPLNSKRRS
jgi:hypothetical protein